MSILVNLTEGWTAELGPFTLKVDGVVLDLTGFTVTIVLHDGNGVAIVPGGSLRVGTPASLGQVYYTPAVTDFVSGTTSYKVHFKVTDGLGKIVFFPNGLADEIPVAVA